MEVYPFVGANIQRIRKTQKLSIDRAAELAGVSKSMLGQIERGTVNPTIGVLMKVARGLHVPLEMLVENRQPPGTILYRAVDVTGTRLNGGKVIRHTLFPFDPDSHSESCQMDIFVSGSYASPDQIPDSLVYVTVLSGTLEVLLDEKSYLLENRDSITFPGNQPYTYRNGGNNIVRLIQRVVYRK